MPLRLLLQLLLVTHACAHALPDGHALSHSLHRRMPPPKLPSGSTYHAAGKPATRALDPATGAPAEIFDPVRGQFIGDVNPGTGSAREGFNPMTGQLYDHQPGRMDTPRLGSPPLPQDIPESPAAGPSRGANRKPVPDRASAWPRHTPSPRPEPVLELPMHVSQEVFSHGYYLSTISKNAVANNRAWRSYEWDAIDIGDLKKTSGLLL